MRERRLLERLRAAAEDEAPGRRVAEDAFLMRESVRDHLERILNTRRGNVPISQDYGIPDLPYLMRGYHEQMGVLEEEVRRTVEKFEPRLRDVRVKVEEQHADEDQLTVGFLITADLTLQDHRERVNFSSVLKPDGKVAVKGWRGV